MNSRMRKLYRVVQKKVYICLIVCMIINYDPIDVIYGLLCRPSTLNLDAMLLPQLQLVLAKFKKGLVVSTLLHAGLTTTPIVKQLGT